MNTFCFSHHSVRPALQRLTLTLVSTSLLLLPLVSAPTAAASQLITGARSNFTPSIIEAEQLHVGAYATRASLGVLTELQSEGVAPIGGTKTSAGPELRSEGVAPIGGTKTSTAPEVCSEGVAPIGGTSTCA